MTEIKDILEAIRTRYMEKEIMSYEEDYLFDDGGTVQYMVEGKYEIIGAFQSNNRIKVIVHIKEFSCSEDVFDRAIEDFENYVKEKIIERVPDVENYLDILSVREKDLKKITEYAYCY